MTTMAWLEQFLVPIHADFSFCDTLRISLTQTLGNAKMSSQKKSIQNVLAPTTRPSPKSQPPTTGTKLPTIQQVFARRTK
ncbi:hypothetical protein VNO80_06931 [Phaseolus coccineus]|uniref:Uncharacterized protein n=1 Tax=Phaseolus coccineus TaxID=3886 RepID=A0AAN9RP99_PHACN